MTKCMICGKEFIKSETKYRIAVCSEECYQEWHESQKGTGVAEKFFDWSDYCGLIWCVIVVIIILIGAFIFYTTFRN